MYSITYEQSGPSVSMINMYPPTDTRVPFLYENLVDNRRCWLVFWLGFMKATKKWLRFFLLFLNDESWG